MTNARAHTARRFVVNFDIEDYFPSFNFGRVRGFFISNNDFKLSPGVATILAQIAIHNNELPQGSPCSPVIADLITHVLDVRLAQLAKSNRCMYSRYTDDITFSTNQIDLPSAIASGSSTASWALSSNVMKIVSKAGFTINTTKTRVQTAPSRQVVTGLTVNKKVNIHADYYRSARSMCNALFTKGIYHAPVTAAIPVATPPVALTSLLPLEGALNFIYSVKAQTDYREAADKRGSRRVPPPCIASSSTSNAS